ncbi:DUF5615 family PIN-like protein [Inquilinus limosus]|uniref:DUF5615 family PIN-like protein n=1 Tax=Inquilinus limosus TaxID=171674 RepID=UPI003F5CF293
MAHQRGYAAQTLVDLGKAGLKDWDVMKVVAMHDLVLVTNNVIDFLALYRLQTIHPGVALLKGSIHGRDAQCRAFAALLDAVDLDPDLVNQVVEVTAGTTKGWSIRRYPLP